MKFEEIELSGFGKYPKAKCRVTRPPGIFDLNELLKNNSVIARGLGRSYGDASLNDEGVVSESILMNRFISFDEETGIVRCEAGVTYKDLLDTFVLRGWFPAVTPGTKYVTMGGAIASDVHGKNHHNVGSFSTYVISFKILVASGKILDCSRENNADLFWATVGGMGLTGFILEAEIQMKKITSPYLTNRSLKLKNMDELFDKLEEFDKDYFYSVAWMDIVASGKKYGRNVLLLGNHEESDTLSEKLKLKSAKKYIEKKISVPFEVPFATLNKISITLFNSAFYMAAKNKVEFVHYDKYFYPLDFILNWNHIYSKSGLIQYQLNVPDQDGILSFPFKGYTLSMDFPVKKGVIEMCKVLDQIVLDYGGRNYLTKDSILDEKTFKQMYSGLWEKWMKIKIKYDPDNKFTSNLARRIGLCPF
jgi:hypothetical protein